MLLLAQVCSCEVLPLDGGVIGFAVSNVETRAQGQDLVSGVKFYLLLGLRKNAIFEKYGTPDHT